MDMDFLITLLPGFQCEINSMTGCGISDIAAGWISLRNKSHGWTGFWISLGNKSHGRTWNFQ
jgi:hypothetical protein